MNNNEYSSALNNRANELRAVARRRNDVAFERGDLPTRRCQDQAILEWLARLLEQDSADLPPPEPYLEHSRRDASRPRTPPR
jgi:hypothetical protein